MRNQFTFYKSFDDVYQDLDDKQRIEFMTTMLDVQFLRIKVEDVSFEDKILKYIWIAQKHTIYKSIKGYLESQKSPKVSEPFFGVYADEVNIKKDEEPQPVKDNIDYEFYIKLWNQSLKNTPVKQIIKLTDCRRKNLTKRVHNAKDFKKAFEIIVQKITKTPFLLGENGKDWIISFDWIISNDKNYVNILEGKYE